MCFIAIYPVWRVLVQDLAKGIILLYRLVHRKVKLHTSNTDGLNLITAYGDDYVAVNHQKHEKNLIVLPENLIPEWSTATIETLAESDMQKLLELGVEVILLGTGKRLRFPAGSLMRPFAPAGIGLEIMDLQAACRTYNILASEGRKVAAALLFD
jgi:uncharacterized protein